MNYFLIYPNNLFQKKQLLKFIPKDLDVKDLRFLIIEDPLFFGDKERIKNFTKLKLVLHRASMQYYEDYLKDEIKVKSVKYIEYKDAKSYLKKLKKEWV